jgi:hypothetical protein
MQLIFTYAVFLMFFFFDCMYEHWQLVFVTVYSVRYWNICESSIVHTLLDSSVKLKRADAFMVFCAPVGIDWLQLYGLRLFVHQSALTVTVFGRFFKFCHYHQFVKSGFFLVKYVTLN